MQNYVPADTQLTFTCKETAAADQISVAMVRKLVRQKKLEAVRIGRCVRIHRRSVLELCGARP
jgi:excisionase family DNA binding protein